MKQEGKKLAGRKAMLENSPFTYTQREKERQTDTSVKSMKKFNSVNIENNPVDKEQATHVVKR